MLFISPRMRDIVQQGGCEGERRENNANGREGKIGCLRHVYIYIHMPSILTLSLRGDDVSETIGAVRAMRCEPCARTSSKYISSSVQLLRAERSVRVSDTPVCLRITAIGSRGAYSCNAAVDVYFRTRSRLWTDIEKVCHRRSLCLLLSTHCAPSCLHCLLVTACSV